MGKLENDIIFVSFVPQLLCCCDQIEAIGRLPVGHIEQVAPGHNSWTIWLPGPSPSPGSSVQEKQANLGHDVIFPLFGTNILLSVYMRLFQAQSIFTPFAANNSIFPGKCHTFDNTSSWLRAQSLPAKVAQVSLPLYPTLALPFYLSHRLPLILAVNSSNNLSGNLRYSQLYLKVFMCWTSPKK